MSSVHCLQESISQYESQLLQVQTALAQAEPNNRAELVKLRGDIEELISLTKTSLSALQLQEGQTAGNGSVDENEPAAVDDEYALFQAEIAKLDDNKSDDCQENGSSSNNSLAIQDELRALEGMKCQAPHSQEWGELSFHNAIVFSVEPVEEEPNFEEIKVRVIFCNPICKSMLPCPYFLDGRCRFLDEECRFSHGEVISLSQLKEYKEPNFSKVKVGSRVLAKYSDGLWYQAVVESQAKDGKAVVRYQSYGNTSNLDLSELLPPCGDEDSDDEDDDDSTPEEMEGTEEENMMDAWLLRTPSNKALGEWEKHTRGIGSKLMAKMGYVIGSGLGKDGEGRIEPVEAVIIPAGKSLDHCMELKERAGGEDLFKVEKRLKRKQKKEEERQKRQYKRAKEHRTLFDFINSHLGGKSSQKGETLPSEASFLMRKTNLPKRSLKEETTKKLNIHHFQIGESIKQAEKDLSRLQTSLSRHSKNEVTAAQIRGKISEKKEELDRLHASERKIQAEQTSRKAQKKLTVF